MAAGIPYPHVMFYRRTGGGGGSRVGSGIGSGGGCGGSGGLGGGSRRQDAGGTRWYRAGNRVGTRRRWKRSFDFPILLCGSIVMVSVDSSIAQKLTSVPKCMPL